MAGSGRGRSIRGISTATTRGNELGKRVQESAHARTGKRPRKRTSSWALCIHVPLSLCALSLSLLSRPPYAVQPIPVGVPSLRVPLPYAFPPLLVFPMLSLSSPTLSLKLVFSPPSLLLPFPYAFPMLSSSSLSSSPLSSSLSRRSLLLPLSPLSRRSLLFPLSSRIRVGFQLRKAHSPSRRAADPVRATRARTSSPTRARNARIFQARPRAHRVQRRHLAAGPAARRPSRRRDSRVVGADRVGNRRDFLRSQATETARPTSPLTRRHDAACARCGPCKTRTSPLHGDVFNTRDRI